MHGAWRYPTIQYNVSFIYISTLILGMKFVHQFRRLGVYL